MIPKRKQGFGFKILKTDHITIRSEEVNETYITGHPIYQIPLKIKLRT